MTRPWQGVAVGVLAITLSEALAPSQASTGRVATISVLVTRQNERTPVTGLSQQDFEVWLDGQPVAVQSFSAAAGPLTGVVLLDCTWTMSVIMAPFTVKDDVRLEDVPLTVPVEGTRAPHRPLDLYLEPVRQGLLPHLRKGDQLRFASIGRQIRISPSFVGARRVLDAEARTILDVPDKDRYGPSPIWDGIDEAVAALESEPGQRAIILVTDGFSTGNRRGLADVARRAALSGAAIYVVHEPNLPRGPVGRFVDLTDNPWIFLFPLIGEGPAATLERLSNTTGGVYVTDPPRTPDNRASSMSAPDLARRFEMVLAQLHKSYRIDFEDPYAAGSPHRLEVRVKAPGLRTHAPVAWRSAKSP
jgi:hypothetical protein